jgi:intermediate peptidase
MLDRISNEVCSIIDPAELCRNVHTNDIYRSAADEVFHTLISLIQELNSNVELYRKLSLIVNDESLFNQLSVEGKFIAQDMKTEMEINGIHLDENDKMKVAQLQVIVLIHVY